MDEGYAAFEPLRGGHGLLRELPGMPTQVRKVAPGFNRAWVPGKGG